MNTHTPHGFDRRLGLCAQQAGLCVGGPETEPWLVSGAPAGVAPPHTLPCHFNHEVQKTRGATALPIFAGKHVSVTGDNCTIFSAGFHKSSQTSRQSNATPVQFEMLTTGCGGQRDPGGAKEQCVCLASLGRSQTQKQFFSHAPSPSAAGESSQRRKIQFSTVGEPALASSRPPQQDPWRSPDPHFGNHCPQRLIKLLCSRVPYGHQDHREHLLGGPGRGHLPLFMEARLLTQSPLSDCASLFTHEPSRVTARTSGSKRTSRDDKFRKFAPFFSPRHGAGKQGSDGGTTFCSDSRDCVLLARGLAGAIVPPRPEDTTTDNKSLH